MIIFCSGDIAFLVPEGNENIVMTYGNAYTGLTKNAWISLEFSDHISKDVAKQLKSQEEHPHGI